MKKQKPILLIMPDGRRLIWNNPPPALTVVPPPIRNRNQADVGAVPALSCTLWIKIPIALIVLLLAAWLLLELLHRGVIR